MKRSLGISCTLLTLCAALVASRESKGEEGISTGLGDLHEYGEIEPEAVISSGRFGSALALQGTTLAIGAPGTARPSAPFFFSRSAVTVLTRDGATWKNSQELRSDASNSGAGQFGFSLALSDDTLVVGAPTAGGPPIIVEDVNVFIFPTQPPAPGPGEVHVFERKGGQWEIQTILRQDDGDEGDDFGYSVAVSGDMIVVGAPGDDADKKAGAGDDSSPESGAAYVFERVGNGWERTAYLKVPAGEPMKFGASVGFCGNQILVGAPGATTLGFLLNGPNNEEPGKVFTFSKTGDKWEEDQQMVAAAPGPNDQFGLSLSVSGTRLAVGARNSGAAYLYERGQAGQWVQTANFKGRKNSLFGHPVALDGCSLVVGAAREEFGTAHLFSENKTGGWKSETRIGATNEDGSSMGFGDAFALERGSLLVGSPRRKLPSSFPGLVILGGPGSDTISEAGAASYFAPPIAQELGVMSLQNIIDGNELSVPEPFGRRVGLEYSRDLTVGSWVELGNFSHRGGLMLFLDTDPARAAKSKGFYRAFLRPN